MLWLSLGILSGFFHSLMGAASKKSVNKTDEYISGFAYSFFALPFFLLALFWSEWAALNFTFWWTMSVTVVLSVTAIYLFMKALNLSELSLVAPLLALTPLFLIFTSDLILGEFPSFLGISGIISIVLGVYILNIKEKNKILEPLKSLLKNKGAQAMLMVAFIYSIACNVDKIAIQNSNPVTFLIISKSLTALIFLSLVCFKSKIGFQGIKSNFKWLIPIGIFSAGTLLSQMIAINIALVPYIISLKRSSALFSVVLGFLIFKEKNTKPKLLGAAIMVVGVFLISIS